MEYVLIFHEPHDEFDKRHDPALAPAYWGAWKSYIGAISAAGVMKHGNGLMEPATASQVRLRDGKRDVQDGPYADSKEFLGGYIAIETDDLDGALEWAARSPAAQTGTVEVRSVLPPFPE